MCFEWIGTGNANEMVLVVGSYRGFTEELGFPATLPYGGDGGLLVSHRSRAAPDGATTLQHPWPGKTEPQASINCRPLPVLARGLADEN